MWTAHIISYLDNVLVYILLSALKVSGVLRTYNHQLGAFIYKKRKLIVSFFVNDSWRAEVPNTSMHSTYVIKYGRGENNLNCNNDAIV